MQSKRPWTAAIVALGIVMAIAFFFFDRYNGLTTFVRSYGATGVTGAILMMALLCMTPFPSEALLAMYLKVYGVFWGTLYGWIGFMLASLAVFAIARYFGNTVIRPLIAPAKFQMVDDWIDRKGSLGLLVVRLLPIPALVINCVTGILPSVSLWKYTWTGALGIVPYYLGVSMIYLGVSRRDAYGYVIGIFMLGLLWLFGYGMRRWGKS